MVPKRIKRRTFKLNKGVLSLSMLSVVLFEVEQLLGEEFRCPQGQVLGITYSLLYFLMPALVWFILGLRVTCGSGASCQYGTSSRQWTCFSSCFLPFFRACILPTVWVLFLLRDGRYDECILDSLLYEDPTAKPDTQNPDLYSPYYIYIQMAAIVAIGLLIIFGLLLTWRCSEASDPICLRLLCCCCPACAKEGCETSLDTDGYELEVTEEVEIKILAPA